MSSPGLLYIDPAPGGFERWAFSHARDHDALVTAANATGAELLYYILDPVGGDFDTWLFNHQRAHDDLGFLTGVANADLSTVDWNNQRERDAWLQLDWQEHQTFSAILGI